MIVAPFTCTFRSLFTIVILYLVYVYCTMLNRVIFFFLCFLGTSIFNEDHNFKTPDKVSVRDFKHKGRLVCNM